MEQLLELARAKLPVVRRWIWELLEGHRASATPVAELGFTRLPRYFDAAFLNRAKVVITESLPKLPLAEMGLEAFVDFGELPAAAITFRDTYFINARYAADEALHGHELVHVVQWDQLGVDGFLMAYAFGLLTEGYENNELERQACKHAERFDSRGESYDIERAVRAELSPIQAELRAVWLKDNDPAGGID
jgi:hypothetical protein